MEYDLPRIRIRVRCSKGTYIRSLAGEIGQALGSGAHLTSLCRTRSGGFRLDAAHELNFFLEKLQKAETKLTYFRIDKLTVYLAPYPQKLPAALPTDRKKMFANTFSHETIAIRLRLLRRPAGEIPGRKPGRIPPDGGQSCQGHHRTPHFQGDHRILRRKGPLRLQRHQGLPGPSVRQQGRRPAPRSRSSCCAS